MNNNNLKNPKAEEIRLRRMDVERLHIWGHSVSEIARELRVDERTVSRDIQENRRERLQMLVYGTEGCRRDNAKEWTRNELADYVAFMDEAKRSFLDQSRTFNTEAARTRALWYAVEVASRKIDTIKTLILSLDEISIGGLELHEDFKHDFL